ncbi:MAG: hypothetical protein M3Q93_00920 [Gemmatimonadota bacterium]|nr:hypothetical protein [Gemmatimonadales bacterium]MDQ3136134.1 hypothetical protein [Gemmatimonadota bacterium]
MLPTAVALVCITACARGPSGQAGSLPSPLDAGVLRASQAPILGLPDILALDSLVGKRVRVLGWCVSAPGLLAGRRSGAWFLATPDTSIEVRGLVPLACGPTRIRQTLLLVFAQVVPSVPDSAERLLLRLPE